MMRQVYLVSALLLCHPVSSDRDADCSSRLTPEAEMKCRLAKRKSSSSAGTIDASVVEMAAGLGGEKNQGNQTVVVATHSSQWRAGHMTLTDQINTDILLHIATIEDKETVAKFNAVAMTTILDAVKFFTQKNHTAHNITQGISKLALGLWDCVMFFIPDQTQQTSTFRWFQKAWTATFEQLRSVDAAEIDGRVQSFNENGKGLEVAHVVYLCVDASVDLVDRFVNGTVAAKIMPWFHGVRAITKGVVRSWEAIASGEPHQAAEAVYTAIREASEPLLPDSVKQSKPYEYITGILDVQIGNLNRYVMGFKKTLAQSKICLRRVLQRNSSYNTVCTHLQEQLGGKWLKLGGCCRKESDLNGGGFIQEWESGAREELLQLRTRATCITPPECPNNGPCPFDAGEQMCIARCRPPFSNVKSKNFCYQDCPGTHSEPVDGHKKCAENVQVFEDLNMERIQKAATAVMGTITAIFALVNGDDEKAIAGLNSVFQSGVEFAQSFSFPECAMPSFEGIRCTA